MSGDLLQTKLYLPPVRPNLVARPQLIDRLNRGLQANRPLTFVSAPAGFGKTSLISHWLEHLASEDPGTPARQGCWLSLDANDNDPARFTTYLLAAIGRMEPGLGEATASLLQLQPPPPPETIMTTLINEIAASPTASVLVLDDYHLIQSPLIHQQLTFFLENLPPNLHFVILTREDPLLPIARWRAGNQVTEVRQPELSFSVGEASRFLLGTMALPLAADEVDTLVRRTEGWIAGLQLAAAAMKSLVISPSASTGERSAVLREFVRAFAGSSRFVLDYLVEEVFDRQTAGLQSFLLQTAVLDRLCAPLCDHVTRRSDSKELLTAIEHANLFILPLDQEREWYRFHRLFGELLRHRLRESPDLDPGALHLRASQWFQANGLLEEAVEHALASQDWSVAEQVIIPAAAQAIRTSRVGLVSRWMDAVPEDQIRQSHWFAAIKGWGLMMSGQYQPAEQYAEISGSLMPEAADVQAQAVLMALRCYLAMARLDIGGMLEIAARALELLEEDDPHFLRGAVLSNMVQAYTFMGDLPAATSTVQQLATEGQRANHPLSYISARLQLGWFAHLQGKRREAVSICRQAIQEASDSRGRPLPLAGLAHISLGMLHHEAYELEAALDDLEQGLAVGQRLGPVSWVLSGQATLAQLYQAMGQGDAALELIARVRREIDSLNVPFADQQIAAIEAEIRFRHGDRQTAHQWLDSSGLSPADQPDHMREPAYLLAARLLIDQDRLPEFHELAGNLERFARQFGRQRTLLTIFILRCLAAHASGESSAAQHHLEQAVSLAAPEAYYRPFMEEADSLAPLLPAVRPSAPDFVQTLMAWTGQLAGVSPAGLLDPLSDRELEVLQLIVTGLSNREIADHLVISVGTVKTHAHHIYGKLDVNGRPQAIARARELGLA